MSKSTYDIASNARHLAALFMDVADADGVVDEELYDAWMAKLEESDGDTRAKLQSIRAVKARVAAEGAALKAEAQRVTALAKRREGDVERLRGYMLELLLAHRELHPDVDKIETDDGFVRLNKRTSYEVAAPDLGEVHEKYLTIPEPRLNKTAIVAGHKAGWALNGITVTEKVTEHVMEGG